ncbi:HAMP domain-containing sensor histidine kinase [uncultured Alsobacter sp.]|uniref:sensor histidine kinase n=1 Tax=uncultured Alsobacter sp. TaxID=1748258 RepID=UPI0025E5D2A8|nr:HAMP domain-containing sensor histidine kinase [uncultured Alsobacter sp.]
MISTGSLRTRLLIVAIVTIAATLAVAGTGLVVLFEHQLLRKVAQDLGVRSAELARAFEVDAAGKPFLNRELADPRYDVPYGGAYWQISDGKERIIASRSLWDFSLDPTAIANEGRGGEAVEMEGPENAELYVVIRTVTLDVAGAQRPFTLLVALDHADVVALRGEFARDVWKIMAVLAALLITGAWLQLKFGLSPLGALRSSLSAVREGRQRRLEGAFPAEITPLTDEVNTLLDQRDMLVRRARDRAGTIAHGLKTPLTILSGEIARLEKGGQAEVAAKLAEQCDAIRDYVDRELARSRTHGALDTVTRRTPVAPIVDRLVDLMRRVDREQKIEWDVEIPTGAQSSMEADDLAEVVGNLFDNARKWAASRVEVRLVNEGGRTLLSVADDGPGIDKAGADAVMTRGVSLPGKAPSSTGLGLSIVSDTLAAYDQKLDITSGSQGCRFTFELQVP